MFKSSMKHINTLPVAEPNVLPDFFSTIDSMLRYKDNESVNDEKLIVLCATNSGLVYER